MYKMMGADGKEYGPISADQLHQWIAEGRANAQTRVLPEGATEWKPLADISEFAPSLNRPPSPQPVSTPFPAGSAPKTNPMALTSLILGLISVTCGLCCYGFPFNLLGIIFSLIALSQIKSDPISQQGRGMAIAGLVLCILSVAIGVLFLVLGVAMNSADFWRKMQNL